MTERQQPPGTAQRTTRPKADTISARMVEFAQALRREGVPVSTAEWAEAAEALPLLLNGTAEQARFALRALLVKRREHQPVFDRLFAAFWQAIDPQPVPFGGPGLSLPGDNDEPRPRHGDEAAEPPGEVPPPQHPDGHQDPGDETDEFSDTAGDERAEPGDEATADQDERATSGTPSRQEGSEEGQAGAPLGVEQREELYEATAADPFTQPEEGGVRGASVSPARYFPPLQPGIVDITRSRRVLARRIARFRDRRRRESGRMASWDFPATLRRSLRRGGEVLDWVPKRPRARRLHLVALVDVSASMRDDLSPVLTEVLALLSLADKRELFLFSTELLRVPRHLLPPRGVRGSMARWMEALNQLIVDAGGWGSGTRIGACLHAFTERYLSSLVTTNTTVLIASDGWETGDVAKLEHAMERLARSAGALIWMNPLLGKPGYQPLARGLQAALPWVDAHLSTDPAEWLSL